jgi:SAM-dependent methyltransferase
MRDAAVTGYSAGQSIAKAVRETAARLPSLPHDPVSDVTNPESEVFLSRTAFDVSLVLSRLGGSSPTVVDMGGGMGLFSATLAALGVNSILIDHFVVWREDVAYFTELQSFWASHGVEVIERDLMQGLGELPQRIDGITSFHFLEHLHASPKALFHDAVGRLKQGGVFVVAGPNSVNLRKRVTALFGRAKWSPMDEWYEEPVFGGHVREPDVDDLHYIGRDLGLTEIQIHGRNYLGRGHGGTRRTLTQIADPLLRWRPGLCSDIYLVGQKPKDGGIVLDGDSPPTERSALEAGFDACPTDD